MQNTEKQNYPGLVASYNSQPGKRGGLTLQSSRAYMGRQH